MNIRPQPEMDLADGIRSAERAGGDLQPFGIIFQLRHIAIQRSGVGKDDPVLCCPAGFRADHFLHKAALIPEQLIRIGPQRIVVRVHDPALVLTGIQHKEEHIAVPERVVRAAEPVKILVRIRAAILVISPRDLRRKIKTKRFQRIEKGIKIDFLEI